MKQDVIIAFPLPLTQYILPSMLEKDFSRSIYISQRMHLFGSLSTFIKWLSEHTMQLNSVHYSNGFQCAWGKGGVLRWELLSVAHLHHRKFISPLILMPLHGMYMYSSPYVVLCGVFSHLNQRLVNSHHTSENTHQMPCNFPGTILFMLLHSDSKVQWDVFTKWDYFLPRGVLDPVTNVMKSASLSR